MAIALVTKKNGYYMVFDEELKNIGKDYESNLGEFLGFTSDNVVFRKNGYIVSYDGRLRAVGKEYESNVGKPCSF
jgi:hypothetical protein